MASSSSTDAILLKYTCPLVVDNTHFFLLYYYYYLPYVVLSSSSSSSSWASLNFQTDRPSRCRASGGTGIIQFRDRPRTNRMESIRKREEELMRRNAELEAKSGKAAKNATMILNSTTTMYKENSFLDNFRATSGPETIDSSAVTESADNAAINIKHHHSHHIARLRQCRLRCKEQQSVAQKNVEDLRYSNGRTPQLPVTAHSIRPHQGKAAVPKVTVAAEVEMISHWTLLHRAVL